MPPPPVTIPATAPATSPPAPSASASTREQGSISLWLLCVAVMLLFIGGISLDLWRVFTERQALANAADAAAIAGATAIDPAAYYATGAIVLDPGEAEARALESIDGQPDTLSLVSRSVTATQEEVTVTVSGEVPFTLLRILMPNDSFPIEVSATAEPEGSLTG